MKLCNDSRCIYKQQKEILEKSFSQVTKQTREGEGLWEKCNHCGLVINRSGVLEKDVKNYYNNNYVEKNSFSHGEIISAREHFDARIKSIIPIAEFVRKYLRKSDRVMELGAATGELLYLLKNDCAFLFGNEINQLYATFIKNELGIDSTSKEYLSMSILEKYNFVISINTIDHLYQPEKVVKKVYSDLENGGYFYLEVPNDMQALKLYLPEPSKSNFKKFMYQEAHYYSFNFETIKKLLEDNGFEIIEEYSRHDYTINNFLGWYYLGKPQQKFKEATVDTDILSGENQFGLDMNSLMKKIDVDFREIMKRNKVGESICILGKKVGN
ncbi:MAG: class I SAM-dependent methyltransferase [Spirochaetia bacterium]|nr:class I SAM-dependent methyltransferase [Spirochaetia bacterium]